MIINSTCHPEIVPAGGDRERARQATAPPIVLNAYAVVYLEHSSVRKQSGESPALASLCARWRQIGETRPQDRIPSGLQEANYLKELNLLRHFVMSESEISGSCLCGRVTYAIQGNLGLFQYCHCSRCRKFTGSAFGANLLVSPNDFRWTQGEDSLGRYELAGARHFATSFCKNCGSSLPWLGQSGKAVVVPAGTLDEDPDIRPLQNIYVGSGAAWYEEPASLPQYTEMPPKKR